MQTAAAVAINTSSAPLRSLTARRVNFNADPSIEIAAAFKKFVRDANALSKRVSEVQSKMPDGLLKRARVELRPADRALFDIPSAHNCDFWSDTEIDKFVAKHARSANPTARCRAALLGDELKAILQATKSHIERECSRYGWTGLSKEIDTLNETGEALGAQVGSVIPTTNRGAVALLSVVSSSATALSRDTIGLDEAEIAKVTRNVSTYLNGGSR